MRTSYVCPNCKSHLKVNEQIILAAEKTNGQKGLILLSPELGNYKVFQHPSFVVNKGEYVKFYCPVCNVNLEDKSFSKHLAKILIYDEWNNKSELFFSEVAGEHCTYKKSENQFEYYGEDSDSYLNHFGESPRYY